MTKAIWVLIILVVGYIGYLLFLQWEQVQVDRENQRKNITTTAVQGDSLAGLPYQLDPSLRVAKERGAVAFRTWYNSYERQLEDPRKAWIELELCIVLSRENPAEAKKIFAGVRDRVAPSSPVWPRMKELEKTFE